MPLEDRYSGDAAWNRFYNVAVNNSLSGDVLDETKIPEVGSLSKDSRGILAVAVAYYGIARTRRWLSLNLPELEGKTPQECISTDDIRFRNRIREHLMRLPA